MANFATTPLLRRLGNRKLHLYSLNTPPLKRKNHPKLTCYMVSGIIRLVTTCMLATALAVRLHGGRGTGLELALNEIDRAQWIASLVVVCFNLVCYALGCLSDILVVIATPLDWPVRELYPVDPLYPYYGALDPALFTSPLAKRHHANVLINRVLLTLCLFLCVAASIPPTTWRTEGCDLSTRLTGFILTPFSEDEPMFAVSKSARLIFCGRTEGTAGWIFWTQLAGSFASLLTLYLWCSRVLMLYGILATVRFTLGCMIFAIGMRYLDGMSRFAQGDEPAYLSLARDAQVQVNQFFNLLLTNGLLGGGTAILGGLLSMIVGWRRNKAWMMVDCVVISTVSFLLLATFTANYSLHSIHDYFCRYNDLYNDINPLPQQICQSIQFHYRMNYHFWLNAAAVLVGLVQAIYGGCILGSERVKPAEWRVAEQLEVMEIRRQHPRYLNVSTLARL